MNNMLADLGDLLDYGFLQEKVIINTEKGEYRFLLKTLTPFEQTCAQRDASTHNDATQDVRYVIEILARSIVSVNDVPLHSLQGAQGEDNHRKNKSIIGKFSSKLTSELWKAYTNMQNRAENAAIDEETIKN